MSEIRDLSIIIPTFKRNPILYKTLDALLAFYHHNNFEILVINDDNSVNLELPERFGQVRVYNNRGKGVASARNYGTELAQYNWLLFLDDDIIVDYKALCFLYNQSLSNKKNVYFLNWVYTPDLTQKMETTPFGKFLYAANLTSLRGYMNDVAWNEKELFEVPSGASYCLLLEKSVLRSIGGYNEKFPFAGFEDHDLSVKLQREGVRFWIVPNVTIFHNEEDRLSLTNWLDRQERGAVTRRVAVELGYDEVKVHYSTPKKILYSLLSPLYSILIFIYEKIHKLKILTPVSIFIIKILCGIRVFKGYHSKDSIKK